MEPVKYNSIVVITPKDLERVKPMLKRTRENLPSDKMIFIGSDEVGNIVKNELGADSLFVNENDIIPFDTVNEIVKKKLDVTSVPRGITGWYYQQFLKMEYSKHCQDKYYLSWDGDTVPCSSFSMFKKDTDIPYLDVKNEYNEEYFRTMERILPKCHKIIGKSFISEHMLFECGIMKELIAEIMNCNTISGNTFFEKIINAVDVNHFRDSSFSEFETYGTYVAITNSDKYMLRDWHSLRLGSIFFKPYEMTDEDFNWLATDFHAISFEKDSEYVEAYAELFSNPKYREKLTPRYIIEAIQDEGAITSNVKEQW